MSKLVGRRILITGANRGLGLEMVKQLLNKYNPEKIFATCRKPEEASELNAIATKSSQLHIMQLDITDINGFPKCVQEVERATNGKGIHVLINNAGIFRPDDQSLEKLTMEIMLEFLRVNTFGAIFLTQAFLQLLTTANVNEDREGLVINFASRLGSISDNSSGGLYASRCSRSATNAVTKSMSIDLKDKNIIAFAMNPGWVKTDQGGSSAKLEPEESVRGVLKVLDEATTQQSGRLIQYDGQIMEW